MTPRVCITRFCARATSVPPYPVLRGTRRELLSASTVLGISPLFRPLRAEASLVLFPASELRNRYFLVRAGESENESEGIIDTNPVNKTSMSNGLSTQGKKQILRGTFQSLEEMGACKNGGCWMWPSTTQNAYQTAEILAYQFSIGRERIVPEYSFLDMRGLGAFDQGLPRDAYDQIHAIDTIGSSVRPPPTTTGTPNESAMDVLVRVRQLISVLETQYSGQDVIIISPDSENLTVLQTAILGEETGSHWRHEFLPGEVRHLEVAQYEAERTSGIVTCKNPPNCT